MQDSDFSLFFEVIYCYHPTDSDKIGKDGIYIKETRQSNNITSDIKFYCDICESHSLVEIEKLSKDELNGNHIWGDIVCKTCRYIIASISADKPGICKILLSSTEENITNAQN